MKAYEQTLAYQKALAKRRVWVEPLFGEGKQWHGMGRFRGTRGTGLVNCEALVIASGQNLKRLLQKRGWGRRPFPAQAVARALPGNWEPEASPRHTRQRSDRPGIAGASLVTCEASRILVAFHMYRSALKTRNIGLLRLCMPYYS